MFSFIYHPHFNGKVINKGEKFKSDTSKLVKSLKNLVRKGYDLAIIGHCLWQDYLAKNIDNLLVQLANK